MTHPRPCYRFVISPLARFAPVRVAPRAGYVVLRRGDYRGAWVKLGSVARRPLRRPI
jgi:hypothetical protein